MRCSSCYAENAAWTTVCVMCGRAVTPIEFCPNGHILPPGVRDCPGCPALAWPDVPDFQGPALLRGLLWLSGGQFELDGGRTARWLELRDESQPLGLAEAGPGRLRLLPAGSPEGMARLLIRPDGARLCRRVEGVGKLTYTPLPIDQPVSLANGLTIRLLAFEVPEHAGA